MSVVANMMSSRNECAERKSQVLLVEDDHGDELLALRAFKMACLPPPIVARDGAEAIEILSENSDFSLVLLDVKLPKVNGFEVLKQIRTREATRKLRVVMLSSSDVQADIDASYQLGANSFVTKPVVFSEYLATVRGVLLYWTGVEK